ncbi:MATE family efflux transporter [Alkalimarinus alittae]|uniref:MATE family efflux transporter n=1 Tax=Alkalimarinus alittae TaxID=2961619 RepID=A0ABY6N249_9ALTE|nr:MATE family efflux transporter [Alkalimarinus alittae]UZE96115.1 MATE family efflux transporter [Alkalimarinus alittae]
MRSINDLNQGESVADSALNKRIWAIAWPLIIANITVPLLGLVDAAVLGHLDSPVYLGAVAIGANIFSFIFWGFGFLRMGTTGLVAQAYGAQQTGNKRPLLQLVLSQALTLAVTIGVLLIITQALIFQFALYLIDGSEEVTELARRYCEIRIYSAPATLVHYVLIGWLIGTQNSRGPLIILIVANGINIVLDYWFVMGLGWKSEGVAWATLIAEYSSAAIGIVIITRSQWLKKWQITLRDLFNLQRFSHLLQVNRHLFVRTITLLFTFAFFTSQGAQQSDLILAVNAVLLTFLLLISNGLDGIANAAEALVGEAVGQKNSRYFKQIIRVSAIWSFLTAAFFSLIFWLFGANIIHLLSNIPEVVASAQQYLIWIVLLPIIAMPSYLFDGVFIGATRSRDMQNTMLMATLLVFLPIWWLTQGWGNHGLWFALTLFLLFRGGALAVLYLRSMKKSTVQDVHEQGFFK